MSNTPGQVSFRQRGAPEKKHRPGVTLIEVLAAMFIMAIGMLALLALFPVGAISMAQALRDDRVATAGAMAANRAIAVDLRHDPAILGALPATPFNGGAGNLFINPGAGWPPLPASYFGPSYPVFVDPYGVQSCLGPLGAGNGSPGIPRVSPSYLLGATQGQTDAWFSFLDDITFTPAGLPDSSGVGAGAMERAGSVTWAYLMRRCSTWQDNAVDLSVVVYWKRPLGALTQEPTFLAAGAAGQTAISFGQRVDVRRGGWVLDVTYAPFSNMAAAPPSGSSAPAAAAIVQGYFYQVVNVSDTGGLTTIDVQPLLKANVSNVVVMNDVSSVLDRGVSWRP